jgi:hypothetical protein
MLKSHLIMCSGHIMHLPFCYIIGVITMRNDPCESYGWNGPMHMPKDFPSKVIALFECFLLSYAPILLNSFRSVDHPYDVEKMGNYP